MSGEGETGNSTGALWAWVGLVAVQAAVNFLGPVLWDAPEDRIYRYSNAALALLQFGAMLAVVVIIARPGGLRNMLALRYPSSWRLAAGLGALLVVGMMALLAVLSPQAGEAQNLAPEWDSNRWLPFALNATVIVLVAPMVEELTFRGLGFTLLQRFGTTTAIVGTAAGFALSHGLIGLLPTAAVLGLGLAYLRSRTASVYPGIVVHVALNGLGVLAVVLS